MTDHHGKTLPSGLAENGHNPESWHLKGLIDWCLYSLIALTLLSAYCGIVSHSLAILAVAMAGFLSILLHTFNFISIRCIIRQNVYNFPLGTGKLENFSGFFLGTLFVPISLYILYSAYGRALHPPPAIRFGLAQLLMGLAIARSIWFLWWVRRITKKYPGPSLMTKCYDFNIKATAARDAFILLSFTGGALLMRAGRSDLAVGVDLMLSIAIALYLFISGIRLVKNNFTALIDLPLSETDQLKILKALSAEFESFGNIGNIYSQLSGGQRIIMIELVFRGATTVQEIDRLRSRLEERLRADFGRLIFHLIPHSD